MIHNIYKDQSKAIIYFVWISAECPNLERIKNAVHHFIGLFIPTAQFVFIIVRTVGGLNHMGYPELIVPITN